jgi:hypothetical protein
VADPSVARGEAVTAAGYLRVWPGVGVVVVGLSGAAGLVLAAGCFNICALGVSFSGDAPLDERWGLGLLWATASPLSIVGVDSAGE